MRTGISLTPLFARYLHVAQYGLAALAAFLVATVAPSARGEVVVNAIEAGGDVVIFGEGSLNLGAWTPPAEIDGDFGRVSPSSGDVVVGPITGPTSVLRYTDPVNLMGPDSFGTGGSTSADFGSGAGVFGFIVTFMEPSAPDGQLIVPFDYVSGDPLSASSTYVGATIASLGMTPGEYVWTWGSGDTADSFTLNVGVAAICSETLAMCEEDLGICEQDLGICEGDLGICKGELTGAKEDVAVLLALTADEDGDGLFDQFDSCPGTPAGEAIDASGCSRAQFCETAGGGKPRLCHFADWQNDELGRPRDCTYSKGICQPG